MLIDSCFRRAIVGHIIFVAHPESDSQPILRDPPEIGRNVGVQERNRFDHAEVDPGAVIIKPSCRFLRHARNVDVDVQITQGVV